MAAVADMGEVDEMRSKEEVGILTNGDLSNDVDMDNQDSQDSEVKKVSLSEPMEVDELESKEIISASEDSNHEENSNSTENETEDQSEINEDESSQGTKLSENPATSEDLEASQDKVDDENSQSENADTEDQVVSEDTISEDKEMAEIQSEPATEVNAEEESENRPSDNAESADSRDTKETASNSENNSKQINEEDVIHEIESDDDDVDESKIETNNETIELNDSGGEDDVTFVDSPKQNGTEIIDLDETPEKKQPESDEEKLPPRRSSRNLNKSKSYVESDKEEEPEPVAANSNSEESDIEEILPQDPLACNDAITVERIPIDKSKVAGNKTSTIVVKDTKRLVEIATKTNNTTPTPGKKEPTLVIIDTNSILSGKGPVPVNNKPVPPLSSSTYPTVLPMAVPAQGMYPPNMRATITPIPINSANIATTPAPKTSPATITPALQVPPLLPSLTDDMFVVEAPSFIVPYVYEKPPSKDIKEFIKEIKKQLDEQKEKEKDSKDEKNEKEEKNGKEKSEEKDKDDQEDGESVKSEDKKEETEEPKKEDSKKSNSYFDSPLGKFFINIGFNLVQEQVQSDLLKQQKRKASREGGSNPETEKTIKSLTKNLEFSRMNNEPFKIPIKKCEFCNFKTESGLVMSYHLETPHMKNFVYKCNFCPYEVRSPHDILFHMEAEHTVRGHLERAPAFHQCPSCPFEDNQKGKLSRHLVACMRKFKPDRNLEPPVDWEPPAKIPRVPKMRQQGLSATAAAFQGLTKTSQYQFLSKMNLTTTQAVLQRGRGRPTIGPTVAKPPQTPVMRPQGMVFKQQAMSGGSLLVPTNYQLSGNQVFQVVGGQDLSGRLGNAGPMYLPNMPSASSGSAIQNMNSQNAKKPAQQPSISITPLPRNTAAANANPVAPAKPGDTTSKNTFVICEICDGYIKDLEQLRNHMQWIHKIKIHPKMIYNRPPLNCQKCQFRFFTDQGLERHLLGSHGLVTSSMQDAANKSKDSGRCPVCGRVYQWKLLNHVARDHNMTLKPAHLSYKCTVCTATFGMYKQFENHVYSAHSVVAKRVMDKKGNSASSASPSNKQSDQMKSLKINDEITIIPQPTKTNGSAGSPSITGSGKSNAPGTSKNPESASPIASRAERLARRNANGQV